MKALGVVSDINHRGELLVKGKDAFDSGIPVFDARKAPVGTVLRTFGPVSSPYILIKSKGLSDGEKMGLMNQDLYAGERETGRKRRDVRLNARTKRAHSTASTRRRR